MSFSHKSDTNINAFNINILKLIQLVRGQSALYDSDSWGYADQNHKETIWEHISKKLFPQYYILEKSVQNKLRANVQRRWELLRDGLLREIRKNPTAENYSYVKELPFVSELEFLIPHIKGSHCAKFADDSDIIDFTEEIDIKPIINTEKFEYNDEDNIDKNNVSFSCKPLTEQSGLNCSANLGASVDNSVNAFWSRKYYCTISEFKNGEFIPVSEEEDNKGSLTDITDLTEEIDIKPNINTERFEYNDEDNIDNNNASFSTKPLREQSGLNFTANLEASVHNSVNAYCSKQYQDKSDSTNNNKRAEIESDNLKDVQENILQLRTDLGKRKHTEYEGEDEDRMFLLSLVSDLRRVPAAKKMHVKMEIVSAITRANY